MMPSIAQVYLIEVVEEHKRNVFGTIFAISISFGITLTYVCGYLMSSFEYVCWTFASITGLLMMFVFLLPESPVWLQQSGRLEEARIASQRLWGIKHDLETKKDEKVITFVMLSICLFANIEIFFMYLHQTYTNHIYVSIYQYLYILT